MCVCRCTHSEERTAGHSMQRVLEAKVHLLEAKVHLLEESPESARNEGAAKVDQKIGLNGYRRFPSRIY